MSFILWQRLAAEAAKKRLNEVVEAARGELQTKEEALAASQAHCAAREEEFKTEVAAREEAFKTEVAALKEASAKSRGVKGVGEVMAGLRTRRAAGAFGRLELRGGAAVRGEACERAEGRGARAGGGGAAAGGRRRRRRSTSQSVQALKARAAA